MADNASDEGGLAAGDFASWVVAMQAAIREDRGSDVPCGECTACCSSSQFVHIGPDETETIAHVPEELLFPAPGLPAGHVLLGYDEHGRCPMLVDDQCTIYEHRPRTCRTYDCRVFPAAGLDLDDDDKVLISRQVRRWRFSFPTDEDRARHEAVQAAAAFVDARRAVPANGAAPRNPTQVAVLAVEIHDVFLAHDGETGELTVVDPDHEVVHLALEPRTGPRRPR